MCVSFFFNVWSVKIYVTTQNTTIFHCIDFFSQPQCSLLVHTRAKPKCTGKCSFGKMSPLVYKNYIQPLNLMSEDVFRGIHIFQVLTLSRQYFQFLPHTIHFCHVWYFDVSQCVLHPGCILIAWLVYSDCISEEGC